MEDKLPPSLIERIRFPEDPATQCWVWVGGTKRCYKGTVYGYAYFRGKRVTARRAVYTAVRGEPRGNLKPFCGREDCVNPAHQRIVPRGA